MESDEMKIEFVFGELFKTLSILQKFQTTISKKLLNELVFIYFENINFLVPLSAFLLTPQGSAFWQKCPDNAKLFFLDIGWVGIMYYCQSSSIPTSAQMRSCFVNHLLNSYINKMDPFIFWLSQKCELSDVACRMLTIPCSKASVERLFGSLSYMVDPSRNRLHDDIIDAELTIRMSDIFKNHFEFEGNMLSKLEKSNDFLMKYAFPGVIDFFTENYEFLKLYLYFLNNIFFIKIYIILISYILYLLLSFSPIIFRLLTLGRIHVFLKKLRRISMGYSNFNTKVILWRTLVKKK